MNIKGHGHSLTLVQGHADFNILKLLSLKTARQIEAKFHVKPSLVGETKVCSNGLGHMTNVAVMTIYGKNLKKSSSLETKGR